MAGDGLVVLLIGGHKHTSPRLNGPLTDTRISLHPAYGNSGVVMETQFFLEIAEEPHT